MINNRKNRAMAADRGEEQRPNPRLVVAMTAVQDVFAEAAHGSDTVIPGLYVIIKYSSYVHIELIVLYIWIKSIYR
jgi:hypothetical protein